MSQSRKKYASCLTFRSLSLGIFCVILSHFFIHYASVLHSFEGAIGREALPMPAMMTIVLVVLGIAFLHWMTRQNLLSQGELLFVMVVSLVCVPLALHGFWRRSMTVVTTATSAHHWERFDAIPWNIWPSGEDAFKGLFGSVPQDWTETRDGDVTLNPTHHTGGKEAPALVLRNREAGERSLYRLEIPLESDGRANLLLGTEYLFTLLARTENFAGGTRFTIRITYDDHPETAHTLVSAGELGKPTHLQPEGYVRVGEHGVAFVRGVPQERINLEITLAGRGEVWLTDPRLIDISAMPQAYTGRPVILRSEWERLPVYERAGYIVRPDRILSLEGLQFLFTGYVPWRDWSGTIVIIGTWTVLLLTACFAMVVILRRQWMENERFPLPMDQPLMHLLGPPGQEGESQTSFLPPIFRHPMCWAGAGIALVWYAFVIGNVYNSNVPNPHSAISLGNYIQSPFWGSTWNVSFSLSLPILALVLFMDIHILGSILIGFLLLRMQTFVGMNTGWSAVGGYPFPQQQILGSFFAYSVLSLLFIHRYLRSVLRTIFRPGDKDPEALHYRVAFGTLVACFVGVVVWALLAGLAPGPMLVLFLILLLFCVGAARLRAEAGVPHGASFGNFQGYLFPQLMLPFLGGVAFFTVSGFSFFSIMAGMVLGYTFLFLPGFLASFVEIGHRWNVRLSHIATACGVGIVGGIVIGGWIYLSSAYAVGIDNYPITEYWSQEHHFAVLDEEIQRHDMAVGLGLEQAPNAPKDMRFGFMAYAAGLTAVVTFLRQVFAGFWLHPVGIIIAPSMAMWDLWGSVFAALVIRFGILKLGGASTIREKLFPFATGLLLGCVFAFFIRFLIKAIIDIVSPGGVEF